MADWVQTLLAFPVVGQFLRLLVLLLLFLFVRHAVRLSATQSERRIERSVLEIDRRTRLLTLLRAGYSLAVVVLSLVTITMALQTLGVYILPVLASAGVVGLAVSLGAQSLIRDYIGGILILWEDLFRVGDMVEVAGVAGEVLRMTLRVTYLRGADGKLHTVPNGDIRVIANRSRQAA